MAIHLTRPVDLRIGMLSQWYEPEPGPARVSAVLARELYRRGHAVRVLTGFPNFPEGRIYPGHSMTWKRDGVMSGVMLRRVALYPNHGASTAGRVANYGSFAISASVLGTTWFKGVEGLWVYNSPPSVGVPTWVVKSIYRPRILMHIMDLWPDSLLATGFGHALQSRTWVGRGLDRWLSMTYNVADCIACTSRSQMDLLAERGVARTKLSYVPVWADEAIFRPTRRDEALAAELGVREKFVLLYAGTIGDAQGLESLIEACARLSDEGRFYCLIAGAGIAAERLRALARSKALTNVSFLGRWPAADMTRLMSIGDVHLVSLSAGSLAGIAMPGKLPATLASGKPIIAAVSGDAADIVARSGAGWACQPADVDQLEAAIRVGLSVEPSELETMGRLGRQFYESEFSTATGVDRVERLLGVRPLGGAPVARF